MGGFIGQAVKVELTGSLGVPASFTWQGLTLRVVEIVEEWQDYGFGATHPAARNWRTRRHRNYYRVRTEDGRLFELYLDRGAKRRAWYLYRQLE